jgi:hypothetical protein
LRFASWRYGMAYVNGKASWAQILEIFKAHDDSMLALLLGLRSLYRHDYFNNNALSPRFPHEIGVMQLTACHGKCKRVWIGVI